ncbi:MAG: hypothetical protein CL661_04580 [Bacteroidetes bacterium]|jgi:hypothetical protein|nr:hypothetical protein [Bacteroidota bacterium]|tara:strand:- start:415 stop:1119 length:705 start_codon:yes stop_codon:yes gene_type:complete
MNDELIQTVGTIIKKEKLTCVEHEAKGSALVLESLLPYPGYHGTTIPDQLEPDSLFAVTKNINLDEKIIRSIQKVKNVLKIPFDAAPGTIYLRNNPVNIIRFKGLSYGKISEVIQHFKDVGIEFEKAKKITPYESIIKIRKFIRLCKCSDGIYEDMDVKQYFYLQLPLLLDWDEFEELTVNIKYNIESIVFDAAQANVICSNGFVDFVRIYDEDKDIEKLNSIRNYYLNAIENL